MNNLETAAQTYRERGAVYGNNHERLGLMMQGAFPSGLTLATPLDHERFALFNLIMVKLSRYAVAWDKGGHKDSIHDVIVYAAMLEERTHAD
jgi:hypothetical protein